MNVIETYFIFTKTIDLAILMGGFPRKPGMDRFELIYVNSEGAM